MDRAAKILKLSRKSVRAHYLSLRTRLTRPSFRRWHRVYSSLPNFSDSETEHRIIGGVIEIMAVCYYSGCYDNYSKGNRKNRICRTCPLPHAFRECSNTLNAIEAIDEIRAVYKSLCIRGERKPDKLTIFFERFIHVSVMASIAQHSKLLRCGLLDPSDLDYLGGGTLLMTLMDNLANDNAPVFSARQ